MMETGSRLANRLGMTYHVSALRFKLKSLASAFPSENADCLEDWLVDVGNARGARIVTRFPSSSSTFTPPTKEELPNEELVAGICQLQCLDRPQMLRLAAQLISRRAVDPEKLCLVARRERIEPVLAELARQALRVEPDHDLWRAVQRAFPDAHPLREPLLHWTRLAEPVMKDGRYNAAGWRLVA